VSAAEEFLGHGLPSAPDLPYTTGVVSLSSDRVLDGLLVLSVIAMLYAVGLAIRKAQWVPRFRPVVFTLVCLGVLMFTTVNPLFWQLQSVTAKDDGLSFSFWSGEEEHIAWDDVASVYVDEGRPFPRFLDDSALVLVDTKGETFSLPAFLPGSDRVAAVVADHEP